MGQGDETVEGVFVMAREGSAANTCRGELGKAELIGPRLCSDSRRPHFAEKEMDTKKFVLK
ncbi:hypothetical protein OIU79_009076, partial [Salix purpurea]